MIRTTPHRRWHELYHARPGVIDPPSATALDMFRATAARQRDRALVHYFDRSISASQVDAMSDSLAVALQQRGTEPGDRIAVYLQNIPQVVIAVLAAWKCGAAVVPCNPMWRERELTTILGDSGARVLICQDDLYREVARAALPSTSVHHTITTSALDFLNDETAPPRLLAGSAREPRSDTVDLVEVIAQHAGQTPNAVEIAWHDTAFMVYTSGTTGEPKAALNTHRNVVFATTVYERWIGLASEDTILGLAPLFHVTGLIGHVTLSMLTGSPLVLFYRFDAEEACRLIELHRATFTVSSVTAFIALLNSHTMARFDLTSLTKVYTGGAPTPPGVLADWHHRTGTRIQPMYGLTEATSPTHMTPHGVVPPIDPRTGVMSIGVPVFNTDVRVVTDRGTEAAPGEIGELVIAGPQIVPRYWRRPTETAASLRNRELRTGDVGFMDEAGWFYLVDRAKDMIIASGFKVWPREVEEVLYLHPAVREAAVVGIPDSYRGETIKAVVSLKPGQVATTDEIKQFARAQLAAYKYPRVVEIVDELPKTTSGKIMRRLLKTAPDPARHTVAEPEGVLVSRAS
jgi:long-chain acyl-CoA synthetase